MYIIMLPGPGPVLCMIRKARNIESGAPFQASYIIMLYCLVHCISSIIPRAPIRPRPRLDRAPLHYLSKIVCALE